MNANSKILSIINPEHLSSENVNEPPPPPSSISVTRNMPYDEECIVDEDLDKNECFDNKTESENYFDGDYKKLQEIFVNGKYIGNGKFDYISDDLTRLMCENAWQAITQTNNWDFVAKDIESFMWSKDPRIDIIAEKMEELGYTGHSGCSYGCTMRNMQYLAKNGENNFKKLFDRTHDTEEVEENSDKELDPYQDEDAMEYEERLKKLIKRRMETGYYEKRDKESREKLLNYMGGY